MHTFKRDEIVILLGAGASVEAGIFHSIGMIRALERLVGQGGEWHNNYDLYYYVRSAIHYVDGIRGRVGETVNYNIERLVATLDELAKRDDHPLYPFVGAWNPKLVEVAGPGFQYVDDFKNKIVERLRHQWVLPANYDKARYYHKLIEFQRQYEHPLRIFTLNYDLCVEVACQNVLGKYPERGFEARNWDWRRFDDSDNESKPILLYKLHGSIDWKRPTDGNLEYVDSPSSINASEIALIFGTAYKLQSVDPFLFLVYEFRKWTLESKLIVSIGYGFGDEHINGIIRQALHHTQDRKLLSIVPYCSDTDKQIVTEMRNREIRRICGLLELNHISEDQVEVWNYSAGDFMRQHLDRDRLAEMFPQEPSLFANTLTIPSVMEREQDVSTVIFDPSHNNQANSVEKQ